MANNLPLKPDRTLTVDLDIHFADDVGKIHNARLTAIRDDILKAAERAILRQFPDGAATVAASLSWNYRWREETQTYQVGRGGDDDEGQTELLDEDGHPTMQRAAADRYPSTNTPLGQYPV